MDSNEIHLVKKINYIDGYKISITFNDRKTKIVDIEPYLKRGVFLPLKDPKFFNRVKVLGNTLVWPNEADFCPDVLYEIGVEERVKKKSPIKRRRDSSSSSHSKASIAAKPK